MTGYNENNKSVRGFQKSIVNKNIKLSKNVKNIHPIIENITNNLLDIDVIKYIRISPDFLQASSETTDGRIKTPITKSGHMTAIGVSLIIDFDFKYVQFYEMNSVIKGYGGKMVDAVFKSLPEEWQGVIVMDWSGGFWDKMKERYDNLEII